MKEFSCKNTKLSIAHKEKQLETLFNLCCIKKIRLLLFNIEGISIACSIRKKSRKLCEVLFMRNGIEIYGLIRTFLVSIVLISESLKKEVQNLN